MSTQWRMNDRMIELQPMPSEFANTKSEVLCSDCEKKSTVPFHFIGMKCAECGSYNTKTIARVDFPTGPIDNSSIMTQQQYNELHQQVMQEMSGNQAESDSENDDIEEGDDMEDAELVDEEDEDDGADVPDLIENANSNQSTERSE